MPGDVLLIEEGDNICAAAAGQSPDRSPLTRIAAACNNADLHRIAGKPADDPTELALLELAPGHGLDVSAASQDNRRRQLFRFDPRLKLMTTVDELDGGFAVHTKGALEQVLALCTAIRRDGREQPITAADRNEATRVMTGYARRGLRVLAFTCRRLPAKAVPDRREDAERNLCLAGLAAMLDPPRQGVPAAIEQGLPRRHPHPRGHRRQRADRCRHRLRGRYRHRRDESGHWQRARRDDRERPRRPA